MKKTKFKWLLSAMVATALSLGAAHVPAQAVTDAADTNLLAETNPPTGQVAADTNDASDDSTKNRGLQREAVVVFGKDAELKAGDSAEAVVAIGGSAIVHGHAHDAAVAIGGNVFVDGEVGDSAVAIMGGVKLGPTAIVHGDVVSIGGKVEVADGAVIKGHVQEIDVGIPGLPKLAGLKSWIKECVFKMRPLAPQVAWVWVVAGVFFLIYFLVALAFPRPVQVGVNELTTRPATTVLVGLLVKLLVPVIVIILAMTGVGLLVVPLLFAALFFGAIIGKVALIEYFGAAIGRMFGFEMLKKPLAAFLLGIVFITLLYMVPVVGFVAYAIVGLWGLGVAITALFSGMRRERRPPPQFPSNPASPGAPAAMYATVPPTPNSGGAEGSVPPAAFATAPKGEPPLQSNLPVMLTYPKAGFWERMGAAFLDIVLLSVAAAIVGPFVLLVALAYFAGMWAWKGTTVGGIVLKLQVVRYDGGPLTFPVALVRGLAAAFSAFVFFLGFFWIGWDHDKQGWHDKIAGTVVVRLPRSMPLVCL